MTEINLDDLAAKALRYLEDDGLKPRDFTAIAKLVIEIYELKLKEGSISHEDIATLLEKIPGKAAKRFLKILEDGGETSNV